VRAAELYDGDEPINIGSSREISIRELAEIVATECGFEGSIRWDPSKPNGQPRRKLDTARADRLIGFRASTSFEEGLRETISWYVQNAIPVAV
jgi:nucleoside-diphosphate-sugar epimerase